MGREKIAAIRKIHEAARTPLFAVLDGITPDQLAWKPAAESRSIGEIMRHLIRVDNWFLKRLGYEPDTPDQKDAPAAVLKSMLESTFAQIERILERLRDDEELIREAPSDERSSYRSLWAVLLHESQHYHYHLAQMVYLRRAQDRTWEAPLKSWEHGTDVLAAHVGAEAP